MNRFYSENELVSFCIPVLSFFFFMREICPSFPPSANTIICLQTNLILDSMDSTGSFSAASEWLH